MKKTVLTALIAVIVTGSAFALHALTQSASSSANDILTDNDPVVIVLHHDNPLPYLITAGGQLLAANADNIWHPIGPRAKVNAALHASTGHLWIAADSGLYVKQDKNWQLVDSTPGHTLESTHGFLFSIGPENLIRVTESRDLKLDSRRELSLPDSPARDVVMLGSHTHVLHTSDQVFQTLDVGLSWRSMNAPEPLRTIWTDAGGNLIAATDARILRWMNNRWENFLPLPDSQPIDAMRVYRERIYLLAGGELYEQVASGWHKSDLPDSQNIRLTSIEFEYPDTLWLLNSTGKNLYSTSNGQDWVITLIQMAE